MGLYSEWRRDPSDGCPGRARRALRLANARQRADGRRSRPRRGLAASFLALVVALVACAGASAVGAVGADEGPLRSTGSSTIGIFVDSGMSEEEMEAAGRVGNDSNLGIFVAGVVNRDMTVTFMSEGSVYDEVSVGYGSRASAPTPDPTWQGGEDPERGTPAFGGWCVDEVGSVAYDFAAPVTRDLVLYAAWDWGDPISIELDGCGGTMEDPGRPGSTPVERMAIERYPGSTYRSLPTPARTGHTFAGWFTRDGRPDGDWGAGPVAASDVVTAEVRALFAQWEANGYFVRYVNNDDAAGGGAQHVVGAVYGVDQAVLGWDEVRGAGFRAPSGKAFDGWNTLPDGTGDRYSAGATFRNLTDEPGGYVALYAQWRDSGTVEPGPFDVRFVYGDATEDLVVSVPKYELVPEPEAPKRTGYQFGGWFTDDGTFDRPWDFATPVDRGVTLYARWDLRLDVTVPVSVAFAVDAATGEAAGPEPGRYALKSRTVREVEVESLALESRQEDLEAFFALAEGAGWEPALAATELSLAPAGADAIGLPLAGEEADGVWTHERPLSESERSSWRLAAFDYDATSATPDDAWEGADPSVRLPLALALSISDDLEVLTGQVGPVPITRLRVTVSAKD